MTNPLSLSSFTQGTYAFNYTISNGCGSDAEQVQLNINANPVLSNANLLVSSPVCSGSAVTVGFTAMIDGAYTINYDLSGANVLPGQSAVVTIVSGVGSFVVPPASVPNLGVSTITFTSISNNNSNCVTTLAGVLVNFTIVPLPEFTNATLSATSVCLGSAVQVTLSGATSLPNGTYIFGYTIPEIPFTANTASTVVSDGSATVLIPGGTFTVAGNYTITLNAIDNGVGCTNTASSISAGFEIFAIPDLSGAVLTAADVCFGSDGEIIISDATSIPDGSYTITYQLTGAATASGSATVAFTGGDGSFAIPSAEIQALGTVTITIQGIESLDGTCGPSNTVSLSGSFEVSEAQTPVLIDQGNGFCGLENPTVATLAANIEGSGTVVLYDAPTGGTAYDPTDLLVDGVTYYAALNNGSGCESPIRLAITVDLTQCDELLIPDGFSPNGDGINDEFVIRNIETLYPNFKLEIYNRYGNILYKGNSNTPNWNGLYFIRSSLRPAR
ncbi:MAG: T9SS type B sorting domain-containing protein [Sphingobacteriales bacterium]|nr:MAG: T9SS type B sorting domain-containing protein [Sphingobacteriales bacterium]